jgi:tetratricopeptide (TPR) repeat protein
MRVNLVLRLGISLGLAIGTAAGLGQTSQSYRQTALALEQEGKNAEAMTAWRTFLKTHPADPEPYANLGLLEARQEHYKEAVPLYRKALALNPSFPGLRLNLGLALFKADEMKEAVQTFEGALKSEPPSSPEVQRLTILLGMAHYGLGEFAEAAPYLKQAAASDPQNLGLRLSLAHSCLWSKQYQCVLDTYHEILMLNAESAEADMLAGEALDELKDNIGATEQFRNAVKANPKEPNVHFGLGYLLWTQRQYAEAISEFQAENTNDPANLEAMLYLADAEMQSGQPEAARPLLEKVVKLNSDISLAHLDLGIVYTDTGRNEDALRELMLAAKLAPDDTNVHWRLARLYQAMGKKDESKAEFAKTSSLHKSINDDLLNKMNPHTQPADAPVPPTEK